MLDINDLLEALKTRVEQFPDRSAKWLLENTENLRGLLEIIASDIVECLDFSRVEIKRTTFIPDNLREQESDLVYLLPSIDERSVLDQIVSENHPFLDISEKEKQLMQSMAEHYLQQGIEQGVRDSLIEGILENLEVRFQAPNLQEVKVALECIETLQRLRQLRRNSLQAPSLDAFQQTLNG